jgi:transcriptional regulator with XRE-family HTH domain
MMGFMVNERLRRAMLRSGYTVESLAEAADVVSKTAERWITGEVTPYPKTRYRVAALVGEDESYLWPQVVDHASLAGAELITTWPRRTDVPRHLWIELLRSAQRSIDVLAFAGLFLAEDHPEWLPELAVKASAGVRVRMLLGDPAGQQVTARDQEHSIAGGVSGRARAVLAYYQQMPEATEIRLHDSPLYNSVYRFDDEMLVNVHAYGILAAYTPVMHLRRVDGAFFSTYTESFERVWASSVQARQEERA